MSARAPVLAGIHLFYLDDAGVLFCEATQELHLLNATATLILGLIEEGCGEAGVCAELAHSYGIDPVLAARYVADAFSQLREIQGRTTDTAAGTDEVRVHVPWQEARPAEIHCYRFLGTTFEIRYATTAHVTSVHPVLAHLATHQRSAIGTVVDTRSTPQGEVVYRDRQSFDRCDTLAGLAPIVKSLVWITAVNRCEFFLDIHAGVAGGSSGCVLLPGSAGSGKSTLTALLARTGYEFLSDEIALLTQGTLAVIPAPLAFCVKEPGIAALADAYPELPRLPLHLRGDGRKVVYVLPPAESLPGDDTPRTVALVVFPKYVPHGETRLEAIAKPAALKRLLDECVVVRALDAPKVAALVQWIARVPCYTLEYGSGVEAVERIATKLQPKNALPRQD